MRITGLSFDWSDDADSSSSGAATGRFAATATVATFIIWRLYLFCETASSRLSRFVNSDWLYASCMLRSHSFTFYTLQFRVYSRMSEGFNSNSIYISWHDIEAAPWWLENQQRSYFYDDGHCTRMCSKQYPLLTALWECDLQLMLCSEDARTRGVKTIAV